MRIEPFQRWHLQQLVDRSAQRHIGHFLQDAQHLEAIEAGQAFTALDSDRVLACAGLIPSWPGSAQAWAMLANDIGGAGMVRVTRAVLRLLELHTGRIEAVVEADFDAGHRWMRILGFECETPRPMRQWFPDGSAGVLYSRVT